MKQGVTTIEASGMNKNVTNRHCHHRYYSEYDSIVYTKRQPSSSCGSPDHCPDPGTSHRFFASSFDATWKDVVPSESTETADRPHDIDGSINPSPLSSRTEACNPPSVAITQVIHRHANGLCVVTAGDTIRKMIQRPPPSSSTTGDLTPPQNISAIEFRARVTEAASSVGGKRKRARKMKSKRYNNRQKEKNSNDSVQPSDPIAVIMMQDGREVTIRACVAGTVLEINRRWEDLVGKAGMDSMLINDPLLFGYFAVIMPEGDFPPPPPSEEILTTGA